MGSLRIRFILRDLRVARFWGAWNCSSLVSKVVRRCKNEQTVRGVIECFRQTLFRPRRTLLLSVTAAFNSVNADDNDDDDEIGPCSNNITDEELQSLVNDFDGIEALAKKTLFCPDCNKRLTIDKKQIGIVYCPCKQANQPAETLDGWQPYMEAEDVIIWRKEYKPGQGLYAYKVYGRYEELRAQDFAAVQVDGAYRRAWDTAVAALSIVERQANGLHNQAVLHWEVLWPRLFANRDYVYIRRHKEYKIKPKCMTHKDGLFGKGERHLCPPDKTQPTTTLEQTDKATIKPENKSEQPVLPEQKFNEERPSVHSNAKRKAQEAYQKELEKLLEASKNDTKECVCLDEEDCKNKEIAKECEKVNTIDLEECSNPSKAGDVVSTKSTVYHTNSDSVSENSVYVIISRSCVHPEVPETSRCVRVTEYWSNMVVQTLHGSDEAGMEFVLTYYDEPAVGGMPSGVTAWATGRAAPAYLSKMRIATTNYKHWRQRKGDEDAPDFTPFSPDALSYRSRRTSKTTTEDVREEDMESSKQGPEINGNESKPQATTKDSSTQTEYEESLRTLPRPPKVTEDEAVQVDKDEIEGDSENEEKSWWRNMYPFYYFI